MAMSMKLGIFWDVTAWNLVETDRRLRSACCLHHPRRQPFSYKLFEEFCYLCYLDRNKLHHLPPNFVVEWLLYLFGIKEVSG
jgi:hypothetical protein